MGLFLLCVMASFQLAKPMDQWGLEFLVAFVPNVDQFGHNALYITARTSSTVLVENERYGVSRVLYVAAKSSVRVQLPSELQYTSFNMVLDKTVYVNASSPVSVYAINYRNTTADLHIVYPTKTLGTSYVLASYPPTFGVYFLVAALRDNTHVELHLKLTSNNGSCFGGGGMDGQVLTKVLNSRQLWGDACSSDILGSLVYSDKPISVTVGLSCDAVPFNVNWCDHMVETMIPTEDLGNTYILHNIRYRTSGVLYRVVSPYADNVITQSTGGKVTLQQGQYKDYDVQVNSEELCITSSKPVLTLMFTKGAETDPYVPFGDPSMATVPPVEKFTSDYIVNMELVPGEVFERYVALIVAEGQEVGMIVPGSGSPYFRPIGCNHVVAHVAVDSASHWFRHTSGAVFGAMLYAFGYQTGLSTPAGMSLIDKYDYCESGPCQNGATCVNESQLSTFRCLCSDGFNGTRCQHDINECLQDPCKNGATCVDEVNAFSCACAPGFTGTTCETDINECASSPCKNGATCADEVNAYNCTCAPGFTGTTCETDVDECASNPCWNGATCANKVNSYECTCVQGYTGRTCEAAMTTTAASVALETTTPETTTTTRLTNQDTTTVTPEKISQEQETSTKDTTPAYTSAINDVSTENPLFFTSLQTTQVIATFANVTAETVTQKTLNNVQTTMSPSTSSASSNQCSCVCSSVALTNKTLARLKQKAEHEAERIKQLLGVDKSQLSRTIRKATSAPDDRPSASGIGCVGVVFLVVVFGTIVVMDLTALRHLVSKLERQPEQKT